jgi:site-specific DNA recombinase
MKRAIIYARVSTDDQADRGYSLPSQLEACRRNVEMLGYEVVLELSEEYSGAVPIADRPESKKIAAAIKRRSTDAVFVYHVDRLSRDIVDLLATVRAWLQAGIEIYAGDIGKIESEFDIVLVIKGWQGSDERKKIIERTSRGRRTKAESGKVVGGPRPLYGYTFVREGEKGKPIGYAIEEAEAKIVRLIFQWYVNGDETGKHLSQHQIATRLSELGILNPSATGGRKSPRVSIGRAPNMWNTTTITFLLSNEAYSGIWRFGKRIGKQGGGGHRPVSEQVSVTIPAIIDRQTWEAAETQRLKNKQFSRRNQRYHEYVLHGIFQCGCGATMAGYSDERQKKRYAYYRCCQRANRIPTLEPVCQERQIPVAPIEKFVWDYIKDAVSNSERYEIVLREAQKQELETLEPRREQLEIIEDQIAEDAKEFNNIATELARGVTDSVRRALNERATNLEALNKQRIIRRDELLASVSQRTYTEERIQAALQYREDVEAGIENATDEDKRRWYQALGVRVTVKDSKARARCLLPITQEFNLLTAFRQVMSANEAIAPNHLALESEAFDLTPFMNAPRAKKGGRAKGRV